MSENKSPQPGSGFWQIIIPAAIAGILVILICIWIVLNVGEGSISRWSEISTVLLVIPVLFLSLFPTAILVGLIVLVGKVSGAIPPVTQRILDFLNRIQSAIKKISRILVQPVIQPSALLGGLRNIISRKRSKYRIE